MHRVQVISRHFFRRTARRRARGLNWGAPGDTKYKVEPAKRGPARWLVVLYRESLPE